jgi:SAM-dependent methyltransferase
LSGDKILSNFYKSFVDSSANKTISLDIGCGSNPQNPFEASKVIGVDLFENSQKEIKKCMLGFEALPYETNSIDYISAFDLIEHIPRVHFQDGKISTPFIFLMNEIWRVLKNNGILLSFTPIIPFHGAHQDPTHVNLIVYGTYEKYFSNKKLQIASEYGVKANFNILDEKLYNEHLVSILKKS